MKFNFLTKSLVLAFILIMPKLSLATDGIVASFSFQGNLNSDQGTFTGEQVGTINYGEDRFGNDLSALYLDGNGNVITSLNMSDYFSVGDEITISAWFKTSQTSFRSSIVAGSRPGGGPDFVALLESGRVISRLYGGTSVYSDSLLNDDKWHHVVWGYGDNGGYFYVDGVLQTNSPEPGLYARDYLSFGAIREVENRFVGYIDDVKVYSRALTHNEVLEIFQEDDTEFFKSVQQYRVDGKTIVPQAGTVIGNGLVFEAVLEDGAVPMSRALEVEVKPVTASFDGIETFTSAFTEETTISTKVKDFIKASDLYGGKNRGDFKWRARVVEEGGDVSDWVEFGDDGTDFTLRAVPLMTQQVSPYPSIADTTAWAGKSYGFGRSPECKNTIKGCGCALSALTTLARYHGVVKGIDGSDVNPDNLNEWLKQNNGYDAADNIKFHQVMKYFGKQNNGATETRFKIREHNATNPNVIRTFVTNHGPTVANALPTGFTHFFVLDSVLDTGYEMSDPFWYGTDTSNDSKNLALSVQDYDDTINSARLIEVDETPSRVARGFEVHLASPATLLITDNQGRRLGFDPRSGMSYAEIPTGEYWHEADISTGDASGPVHETKIATILDPEASPYTIEVIGESTGEYALSILTSEDGGTSTLRNFASTTSAGAVHRYTASYEGDQLYLDLQRISGFIAWLKAKLPTLPNGVQKVATAFIARYEPQVYAGSMVLTENQRSILAQWEGQKNLTSGLDMVQRIIKSFE